MAQINYFLTPSGLPYRFTGYPKTKHANLLSKRKRGAKELQAVCEIIAELTEFGTDHRTLSTEEVMCLSAIDLTKINYDLMRNHTHKTLLDENGLQVQGKEVPELEEDSITIQIAPASFDEEGFEVFPSGPDAFPRIQRALDAQGKPVFCETYDDVLKQLAHRKAFSIPHPETGAETDVYIKIMTGHASAKGTDVIHIAAQFEPSFRVEHEAPDGSKMVRLVPVDIENTPFNFVPNVMKAATKMAGDFDPTIKLDPEHDPVSEVVVFNVMQIAGFNFPNSIG